MFCYSNPLLNEGNRLEEMLSQIRSQMLTKFSTPNYESKVVVEFNCSNFGK